MRHVHRNALVKKVFRVRVGNFYLHMGSRVRTREDKVPLGQENDRACIENVSGVTDKLLTYFHVLLAGIWMQKAF